MVNDGFVFLNGAKKNLKSYSTVAIGDNVALRRRLYHFKKNRFTKLHEAKYCFVNWYRSLRGLEFLDRRQAGSGHDRSKKKKLSALRFEHRNYLKAFYKRFWSTRTLEWKLSVLKNFKHFTIFNGVRLLDISSKKASVSLYNKFNFDSFLPMYKMNEFSINKKLIDFFLHNSYF